MLEDVEQIAAFDVEDDVLEPDAAVRPELRVLRAPGEVFHCHRRRTTCARKAHIGIGSSVPTSVPERAPRTIIRQPTPSKRPIKNGPEIVGFRPVLSSPAALANRRLQPLGHLTADAGSNFFCGTYNGFSNRRLRQIRLTNGLILR